MVAMIALMMQMSLYSDDYVKSNWCQPQIIPGDSGWSKISQGDDRPQLLPWKCGWLGTPHDTC